MAHNLIFIYYFCKFSTHKKVLDWQCQQLDSPLLAGRSGCGSWGPGPSRPGLPAASAGPGPTLYGPLFSAPESIQLNVINGATTGWNPPPHFSVATWYFYDASVQRIFKHVPSHPTQFSNPLRQRQIFESLEIHLGGERTHTHFARDEMSEFLLLCSFSGCIVMLYPRESEAEDFFWLHRFLGRNESPTRFLGKQQHRKEEQQLQACTLRQQGKVL